jgi:peptide/nickel transport system ATP-binding protein
MPLLEIHNLAVEFQTHRGPFRAVDGLDVTLEPGELLGVVGESGSGKSVTMLAVMGLIAWPGKVTADVMRFNGIDLLKLSDADRRKIVGKDIAMIFQEPMTSLNPSFTVGYQIMETLAVHEGGSRAERRKRTIALLEQVGIPAAATRLDSFPHQLSGGMCQRVMIAMAIACNPKMLIADEPTTALDVTIQAQILKLMRDLQAELGMAVLMITHDLGVVANMAEEIIVLYHGQVMESGTLADIFSQPTHPYLRALLNAVPRFHMEPGERLVPIREIKAASGRLLSARESAPAANGGSEPLLAVRDVSKRFRIRKSGIFGGHADGAILAVDDVSFDIRRGECLGLVGESGCGKTTLSKIIMRALTPDVGEIRFNDRGKTVDVLNLDKEALIAFRRRIQFIFQDPYGSLNPRMTVFDIITEPLVIHNIGDAASRAEMAKELMQVVGLDVRYLKRYPHSFSGGQRQRIGIARALALKPDLLICDEPVSALDVSIQAQILNLLKDLQDQLGLTYLFISHNLAVVDYIADRIAVMCAGRLVELAPKELLFRDPVHPYTRALLAAVPEPDPNYRLDFSRLMEDKASNPKLWPAPFTINETERPTLIDLGDGHMVRATNAAKALEFAS